MYDNNIGNRPILTGIGIQTLVSLKDFFDLFLWNNEMGEIDLLTPPPHQEGLVTFTSGQYITTFYRISLWLESQVGAYNSILKFDISLFVCPRFSPRIMNGLPPNFVWTLGRAWDVSQRSLNFDITYSF